MIDNVSKIRVKTSSEYDVLIGKQLIHYTGEILTNIISQCKVAIVTDDVVDNLYSAVVESSLKRSGYKVYKFVFKNGEESKNICTYGDILSFLAENTFTRTDCVLALGGGVVGDIAGFVSATFLRGIKYVQVPTTLLSQIDSSVGGKTAIDLPSGKNLVGAFYQPSLVICDVDALVTLPDSVFDDGMGEAIKYAILDKDIFDLFAFDGGNLDKLIYLCIDYKRKIVESDERESGDRKLLNLGHTIAHGIEKLSSYKIPHGRAVAIGLLVVAKACLNKAYVDEQTFDKIQKLLTENLGECDLPFDIKQVLECALSDKKRSGNDISLVTIHGVGDCRIEKIPVGDLMEFFS